MRYIVTGILTLLLSLPVMAQNYIGYLQSNYSGVNGGTMNAAFIADNRYLIDVNVGSFSGAAYNNYLYFSPRNMPSGYLSTFTDSSSSYMKDSYNNKIISFDSTDYYRNTLKTGNLFEFNNTNSLARSLFYNHELAVFNFMVCLDDEIAFSFGIKQRAIINVDYISPELLSLSLNSLELPELWNTNLDAQKVKFSTNVWNEYALGIASVVYDEKQHFIKSGLNIKFLQGVSSAYFSSNNLDYELLNSDTAVLITGDVSYGYSENMTISNLTNFNNAKLSPSDFGIDLNHPFKGGGGFGFGVDLGVIYEWRPKWQKYIYSMDGKTDLRRPDKNKYLLRVALSLNDIGGIRYKKGDDSRDFRFRVVEKFDFKKLKSSSLNDFTLNISEMVKNGEAEYVSGKSTFFSNSPTHFIANIDYSIGKNFYLNANGLLAFGMNNNSNRSRYYNSATITPRFDYKYFTVAVPLSVSKIYGARVGASFRLGPYLVIGTSNLKPLIGVKKDYKINGGDIYFALKVPIERRVPRDTDKDLVSDKVDLCIDLAGNWRFRGCPDSDNDGVQDSKDQCPDLPGLSEFNGCPDTDGDKIIDSKDDCPDVAGLSEFNGCPDTDGDKIIDSKDDCPKIAGIAEFNGCPDTDGDGLKDSDDLCPNIAGPKENTGCPDTDGDGLFDYLDDCPKVAGPRQNKGCPWPDTDKDGILDKDDKCPLNAGPIANSGCPYIDTDGDGILDKDDKCVNVPGVKSNFGCPEIEKEEKEILQTAFDNLQFETSKAIIKDVSFESLSKLAELLVKKPKWKLKITGHTDSQGGSQNNLILSKKRAEAVSSYLTLKGISNESRILVEYFGEEKPIADNNTVEGRQKNRRVEMEIIFE